MLNQDSINDVISAQSNTLVADISPYHAQATIEHATQSEETKLKAYYYFTKTHTISMISKD